MAWAIVIGCIGTIYLGSQTFRFRRGERWSSCMVASGTAIPNQTALWLDYLKLVRISGFLNWKQIVLAIC
jgi:hypothetical protein